LINKTSSSTEPTKNKELQKRKERVTSSPNSKSFEYILSPTERKRTALLQIQDLDDPIFGQERVPSGSHAQPHGLVAQIELAPDGPGEVTVPIGQQEHLVVDVEVLLPGFHDEGVVDRNASDGVDPFGLELLGLVDEAREVLLGAGGSEGAGDGEEDGLLVLGEVGDGGGLELAGGVEVGERGVWELVADGYGGGDCGFGCGGGGEFEGFWVAVVEFEGERREVGFRGEGFGRWEERR